MFKIVFFTPVDSAERIKSALFAAGAGTSNEYDRCAWQTLGAGQFRPSVRANPTIGTPGDLEHVQEYRIEVVAADECVRAAVEALIAAHPYEEPAYEVYRIYQRDDLPV